MSMTTVRQPNQTSPARSSAPGSSRPWIINSWWDAALFLWTPLLIAPLILALRSPYVGLEAETIGLIVITFGALGHHFPGMLRAYGDRELFQRFRARFIIAPIMLLAISFPMYYYHFGAMKLVLAVWACWHGFMQIYGFVRIYDAKVGCVSPVTAYWDWLMCLSWCSTAQIFSQEKMSNLLEHWYMLGGPLIPPHYVHAFRWLCLAGSITVLIGFLANHVRQTYVGPPPNSAKLSMLASGIGFWWICMVGVDNVILGAAVFEAFHDVQYLAIVWMYNCRRVNANVGVGAFMRFVFRRGMVALYIALVLAYGMIGLGSHFAEDETLKTIFSGIIWTSTILHYYYDGFIWKVREKSTQESLGLSQGKSSSRIAQSTRTEAIHLLKWSPFIVLIGWLLMTDLAESSSLSPTRKIDLTQLYTRGLAGTTALPEAKDERVWLYSQFEQLQNLAEVNPSDLSMQIRAAIIRANFGQNDEAIAMLKNVLKQHSHHAPAHLTLGQIHFYRGDLDQAMSSFQESLAAATTKTDRANALLKIGELHLRREEFDSAKADFTQAIKENPKLQVAIDAMKKLQTMP